jgi:hypothetical protein
VAQIMLNRPDRNAGFLPACNTGLPEPVEVDVLAYRVRRAGYFDLFLRRVFAFRDCRSTLAAVDTGA